MKGRPMSEIRKRIELWFESLGGWLYAHWLVTLVVLAVLIGSLASQLPKITFDTSSEGFLHEQDPTLLRYNDFRRQFGRDEFIIIAVEPPQVFDLGFLARLKQLHEDLEAEVPHVYEITSLINARNTRGEGDRLVVDDLLEEWPQTEADLAAVRERVMSNPLYINRLISEDGRVTTVVIQTDSYSSLGAGGDEDALEGFDDAGGSADDSPVDDALSGFDDQGGGTPEEQPEFLTDQENSETLTAVRDILARSQGPDFKLDLAGSPVVTDAIKRSMVKDMRRFIATAVLTVAVCLFIMFRRVSGVILPLLAVALAVASTMGLMALFGRSVKLPTVTLPSFILAVGVGAAVHILAMFYRELERTGDKREAIIYALGHSGLAVVMTSLTTAAGLSSFAAAEVAPIADLGIFASVGVMLALVYTVILIPSCLAFIPVKARGNPAEPRPASNGGDRLLTAIAAFSSRHNKAILAATVILIAVSIVGALRLHFTHDLLVWFPQDMDVRTATKKIDHELKGTVALEILVDTGRVNGLYDVEILNSLDRLGQEMEKWRRGPVFIGKASSIADMLKEIHRALNENRPDFYAIPQDPALIPQEFLLFENSGSDDLEDVTDSQFQTARLSLKVPWLDALLYKDLLDHTAERFDAEFAGRAEVTQTGLMTLFGRTVFAAMHTMAKSYVTAGLVITVMMILLIGSIRIGLLSMVPNVLPVCLTLGLMGWFDFPLDMFTMLIGSVAIGLAVDDTVHFMHNYRRYYYETNDPDQAVRLTLTTTGRAMLVTSVVLTLGFFIFMFATMNNLFYFGLLTGITIITALLADYLVAPAMMTLIHRRQSKETREVSHA